MIISKRAKAGFKDLFKEINPFLKENNEEIPNKVPDNKSKTDNIINLCAKYINENNMLICNLIFRLPSITYLIVCS
jgi:hypothetical protein